MSELRIWILFMRMFLTEVTTVFVYIYQYRINYACTLRCLGAALERYSFNYSEDYTIQFAILPFIYYNDTIILHCLFCLLSGYHDIARLFKRDFAFLYSYHVIHHTEQCFSFCLLVPLHIFIVFSSPTSGTRLYLFIFYSL